MNDILMDYVCEELEDVERDGLKAGNLDSTDKLVNIKKNLMKIEKMEGDGYSSAGYGRYSAPYIGNDRMYGGSSYAGRRRDSMGRYSRAEAKEDMMSKMRDLMDSAETEEEKKIIRKAMAEIERV